MTKWITELC